MLCSVFLFNKVYFGIKVFLKLNFFYVFTCIKSCANRLKKSKILEEEWAIIEKTLGEAISYYLLEATYLRLLIIYYVKLIKITGWPSFARYFLFDNFFKVLILDRFIEAPCILNFMKSRPNRDSDYRYIHELLVRMHWVDSNSFPLPIYVSQRK